MKKRPNLGWLGLSLILLVQLACGVEDVSPEYFCEMNGGTWHKSTEYADAYCEPGKPDSGTNSESKVEGPAGDVATEAQVNPSIEETEAYASPTPASVQACNATLYVQTTGEIVETTQELYYRECDHELKVINLHPSEGVWVVRHTIAGTHNSTKDSDSGYWYSDLLFPEQMWQKRFRATFFSDGQASFEYVDKVSGIYNRPECLYLLNSPEVEAISVPVEWACGP
jgi:hypothetical protein